ncbi:MAG: NlpC/P60 family protein [Syntrophomonadaceae bacterium]|nr:NlpC/P60 family protein [Syntrophomonadaceae bacterium]
MGARLKKSFSEYWGLLLFPLLSVLLAIAIAVENPQVLSNREAVVFTYWEHAFKGQGGYDAPAGAGNQISFAGLEPGDILVGGYEDCAYGRFSHAGIYIGNNQVIEGYVDLGISEQSIDHYWNYSKICLLRVEAPGEMKMKAVEYVRKYKGRLFYPLAFKNGERFWNCTKIMWKAYAVQGLDLVTADDFWISPDALYNSTKLIIIREEGRSL